MPASASPFAPIRQLRLVLQVILIRNARLLCPLRAPLVTVGSSAASQTFANCLPRVAPCTLPASCFAIRFLPGALPLWCGGIRRLGCTRSITSRCSHLPQIVQKSKSPKSPKVQKSKKLKSLSVGRYQLQQKVEALH